MENLSDYLTLSHAVMLALGAFLQLRFDIWNKVKEKLKS